MAVEKDVYEVQRLYPQIFVACHKEHVRAVSTRWKLSSQDSSILAHLDRETGLSPRALAKHLGVAPSTMSAAVKRLSRLGYITSEAPDGDKRRRELRLTNRGVEAMTATSVLDSDRVSQVLRKLSEADRKAALKGLSLLAGAARELSLEDDV